MVGTGRFELPTPRTPSECSTRLSHVPTQSSRSARRSRLLGSDLVYTERRRGATRRYSVSILIFTEAKAKRLFRLAPFTMSDAG